MGKTKIFLILAALVGGTLAVPVDADAQLRRLKNRAKRAVENEANRMIDGAVACAIGDDDCAEQAKKDGEPVVFVDADGNPILDENGNPVTDPEEANRRSQKPGEGIWRNYDFKPGEVVWKVTDFSDEPIGRFPRSQIEFVNGNMQIVELNGQNVLEVSSGSVFRVNLDQELPEDFTLEFYLQIGAPNIATEVFFSPLEGSKGRHESQYLNLYQRPGVYFQGQPVSNIDGAWTMASELTPVKFAVDDDYAILYVGTERAANVPVARFERSNSIEFHMGGNARLRSYITDIQVAVGIDDLYDKLMETGEFTTRGIFFDIDSDVIRPESTPTLTEILSALEGHEDLNLIVEGHTDSTGEDDHNQDLSNRRAQSVVQYLVDHGIDGGRLTAEGKGETAPVADNETPEGRQQNRRVVIRVPA